MLTICKPQYEDLWFKQRMLADPETMSYNHAYGGTIPFPEERWQAWYQKWIVQHEGLRYYRYLKDAAGTLVGEISYHCTADPGYLADVVIYAPYRGNGYGSEALELLCAAAKARGISVLYDEIAGDNPAAGLFFRHGFSEVSRTETTVMLKKML